MPLLQKLATPRWQLPQRRRKTSPFTIAWFFAALVAPVALASLYYGLIASNQYVSDFHFTVRQPVADASAVEHQQIGDNISALVGKSAASGGTTGAVDTLDNYTVVDYATSEQAARDLDKRVNLRAMFSRAGVDPFSAFDPRHSDGQLARYWRRMVYANYDPATGLAVIKVRAFAPADALAIATNLIDLSDNVVNSIGHRSRADSVRVAQEEVTQSQRRMEAIRGRLTAVRNRMGVIDPTANAANSPVGANAALSNTLRSSLTELETELGYMSRQLPNPNAPQIAKIKAEMASTQAQLAAVDSRVNSGHGEASLSNTVGEFEQLDTERRSVEQIYLDSLQALQEAQIGQDSQRLYVTTYISPVAPDSSAYPNRLGAIALVAAVSLMVWMIGLLLARSVMDHLR